MNLLQTKYTYLHVILTKGSKIFCQLNAVFLSVNRCLFNRCLFLSLLLLILSVNCCLFLSANRCLLMSVSCCLLMSVSCCLPMSVSCCLLCVFFKTLRQNHTFTLTNIKSEIQFQEAKNYHPANILELRYLSK